MSHSTREYSVQDRQQIKETASEWLIEMSSDEVSDADRSRFQDWLAADDRHVAVYRSMEKSWLDLAAIPELAEVMPAEKVVELSSEGFRWKIFKPLAAAAMVLVAILIGWHFIPGPPTVKTYQTRVAEIRNISLEDGTVVSLGARSAIEVAFDNKHRAITLNGGEAFFSVDKDPERPFIVTVGNIQVRVLGTKFNVHSGAEELRVAVAEGMVEVTRMLKGNSSEPDMQTLNAGQQVVSPRHGPLANVETIGANEPGAWRQGRLVYDNTRLNEVIADANRYYQGQISLATAGLAELRVVAAFRADQIDEMIHTLARTLPIRVERAESGDIVIFQKTVK